MTRTVRHLPGLLSLLAAAGVLHPATAASERPLNVVLILADDLGWTDLAATAATCTRRRTSTAWPPQGVRFTDAYAASVCSPTRAA